jgi:hypothetical protein
MTQLHRLFKQLSLRSPIITTLSLLFLLLTSTIPIENEPLGFVTTGTAIAIIAKADQIAAAADSKIILGRNRLLSSDCKIKQFDDHFFAIAGHRREVLSNFDAIHIATEVCRMTDNAAERVSKFEILINGPLFNMLRITQLKDRSYFESNLHNKTILQAAFFGFERGSPYLHVRSYMCKTRSSGQIMIEVERQECVARCDMLTILGKSRAVEKYISQTADYKKRPPIELARKFVELEIADEPEIVGPPIDILQITRTGAVWKQRKPECQSNSSLLNSPVQ